MTQKETRGIQGVTQKETRGRQGVTQKETRGRQGVTQKETRGRQGVPQKEKRRERSYKTTEDGDSAQPRCHRRRRDVKEATRLRKTETALNRDEGNYDLPLVYNDVNCDISSKWIAGDSYSVPTRYILTP